MSVAVITDSGCDLTREDAHLESIEIVPGYIVLGERRLRDGVDIDRATLFRRLKDNEAPKTEPAPQEDYRTAFARIVSAGNDAVYVALSSQLSQGFANAKAAAAEFGERVAVVDSLGAAGIQVLLARYAVELCKSGLRAGEVAAKVSPRALKSTAYFAVPEINHLGRSGRLPKALVALGAMLNVSLVLKVNDAGAIGPAGQSRSFEKTCDIMADAVVRTIERSPRARIAISHVQNESTARALSKALENKLGHPPAYETINEASPTIAAHLGPGAVGISAIVP